MLVVASVFRALPPTAEAWDNGAAVLPPLAWSSWYAVTTGLSCDSSRNQLSEAAVLETAEALQHYGLCTLGFKTLILDDCWQNTSRDVNGFLHADPRAFPRGMGWLAKALKQRSPKLTLGLYTTPGRFSCMKRPASEGHEQQDVDLWINQWGAGYLKYCVCNTTHARRLVAYSQMQRLLGAAKLPVVYEIDPAMELPMTRMDAVGNVVGAHADVADSYNSWVQAIADLHSWGVYSGNHTRQGHWPLIDILQVGRGGQRVEEYQSQVSMYAMLCSPLIIGVDLRNRTWASRALPLISNAEVLNIHQDKLGVHARKVSGFGTLAGAEVWVRPLVAGAYAVALWNVRQETSIDVGIDMRKVVPSQPPTTWQVQNVWTHEHLGVMQGPWIERNVAPHSLRLLRLSSLPSSPVYV